MLQARLKKHPEAATLLGKTCLYLQTRIAIPRYFSQSYGAYFKMTWDIINIAQTFTVRVCTCTCTMYLKYAPYDWLKYRGMAILVCRKKIASAEETLITVPYGTPNAPLIRLILQYESRGHTVRIAEKV